ncbi:MAG: Fpg/Nei family DNA glycosylase [Actinomycetota bacterium]|nr:Fpg/Nei family DNA glycosylase [Actinomycetota bacterium]
MPEGHTLHRLAHDLTEAFEGSTLTVSSPQGRFAAGAARLNGHSFASGDAYGKHLLLAFDGLDDVLHIHLGLYGGLTLVPGAGHQVVGAVRLRLEDDAHTADLRGPTSCVLYRPDEVEALIARLGPDPLRPDADPEAAWRRISASRTPIAALLMNQEVLAGVGNVYRAEVLFRHRLDPFMPGTALDKNTWDAVWADTVHLMEHGVGSGRIDTVRAEHEPGAMGRPPREDDHGGEVYVYRRSGQECLVCGTPVRTQVMSGRNLFWCPECQQRS